MVLTAGELLGALRHEVRILLHLAGKVDASSADYRPTPKQRSTIELLRYLTIMGPRLVQDAMIGRFDPAAWTVDEQAANERSFEATVAAIADLADSYETLLGAITDEAMREEIEMFGQKSTRGAFLVNLVLCGHAAYRTQLFCYLKACGREELNTMNLWAGVDSPVA
jgi:hypothetical protein